MLIRAVSWSIPVPVRFGGEGAPEHQLLLRLDPMEPDGSVQEHLLGNVRGACVAIREAVVWDSLLERFAGGDQAGVDRFTAQLDLLSAALGFAGRGVSRWSVWCWT